MYHSENKISEYLLQIKIVLALCCGPNSDQFWSSARTRHSRNRQTTAPRRIEKASLEEENLNKICELLEAIKGFTQRSVETNSKVYVPILRSTHRLWNHDESNPNQGLFGFTVRKNYKTELTETVEIHTGQELFHKILEARNGESTKREEFEAFEKFISDQFFPGKKVDIVAKIVNLSDPEKLREAIMQQSISVSINGEERDIHKLGDGVQALIMLTFPIFMAEPGSFIFIEEPELNLHPGMQRIFLEVLKKFSEDEEKNLTFFMTTHSNHFLDLTITEDAPVSIFTLRKNEESKKFEIRNVHSGHNEPLELLGVQNSSVYIANCSLWVEGPTDRRYIRKYLDLYIDEKKKTPFKEDLHYVFFLYGGILLNNYSLEEAIPSSDEKIRANRLNNRFMLVADKDDSPAKQEIHKLRDKLRKNGFEYVTTSPAREIENLLSKEILIEVLPKVFSGWLGKKGEAIALLDAKEIQKTALLTLLRREIGTAGLKASYSKETINGFNGADKKAICEEALKVMTWKKMSPEAKKFTEKIYNFIASQNAMGASNS